MALCSQGDLRTLSSILRETCRVLGMGTHIKGFGPYHGLRSPRRSQQFLEVIKPAALLPRAPTVHGRLSEAAWVVITPCKALILFWLLFLRCLSLARTWGAVGLYLGWGAALSLVGWGTALSLMGWGTALSLLGRGVCTVKMLQACE